MHEQLYRYITASFLLGADRQQYLQLSTPDIMLWNNPDDSSPVLKEMFQALYNLSLGNPQGAYYRAGGVYQRHFERGKVLANPTGQDVEVELQGAWHTDEGVPVDLPLLMPGHTGVILALQ